MLRIGDAAYVTHGRVSRGGCDLQQRCAGSVFLAVEEMSIALGLVLEEILIEAWPVLRAAARELAEGAE